MHGTTRLIVLALVAHMTVLTVSGADSRDLEFGINGHPFTQPVYSDIPIQTQLDLVKESGASWYRVDCRGDANQPQQLSRIKYLVDEARKRELSVLPCIFPPVNLSRENDPNIIYSESFEYSKSLVGALKGSVHVWELDNELDLYALVKKGETAFSGRKWTYGTPDGDSKEHFEPVRIAKAIALIKGLSDGCHAADPHARRIINGTWLHYGLLEHMVENGVGFEIVGWHFYSEMGNITRVKGKFDLLGKLSSFKRPIWITEVNRRGGSVGVNGESEQKKYLDTVLSSYLSNASGYGLQNVMIYELFDEPLGHDNPESYYGLVKTVKGNNGKWAPGAKKSSFGIMPEIY